MHEGQGFSPGSLLGLVAAAAARALASGALQPLSSSLEQVEDGGVRFLVRVLAALARKEEERRARQRAEPGRMPADPFLPHDPALFVADVSATHVALLNKFNAVDGHLLVVTREFEDQRSLLTPADFEAWWRCLVEYEGLGFYNGGPEAGASQPHKHLQVVPLPLAPDGPAVPIAPLMAHARGEGRDAIPGFDFRHAFARLDAGGGPAVAAAGAFARYRGLLAQAGLTLPPGKGPALQAGPYCLLATRAWMLLVPRSRESFGSISVNSLGYAGALLARDEEQLRALREAGPMAVLRECAFPRSRVPCPVPGKR